MDRAAAVSRLRSPFPWFGGKSRAAHLIWPRLGDVSNYIEPFAGSLAVLLARPHVPRVETANDVDAYLANLWRAIATDPDQVAHYADWPVNEADLHARHRWLVDTGRERVERVMSDPEFYDAKVAGWWVWGQCLWIGSGWCSKPEWTGRVNVGRNARRGIHTRNGDTSEVICRRQNEQVPKRPNLAHEHGKGILRAEHEDPPMKMQFDRGGRGVSGPTIQKRPHLATGNGEGRGVHRGSLSNRRPNMGGAGGGQGVQAPTLTRQMPRISAEGGSITGVHSSLLARSEGLYAYMTELSARLRRVRVCCGDWSRVLTPAITTYIGLTGVLLDPPYALSERSVCYSHETEGLSVAVREWAIAHGDDPKMRVALCGYEGEHEMPKSWECVSWKAGGGYGRSARGKANRSRERIWFSPHCLRPGLDLFQ